MQKNWSRMRKFVGKVGIVTGLLLSCMASGASGYVLITTFRPLEASHEIRKFNPWRVKDMYQGRVKILTERYYQTEKATIDAAARLNQIQRTSLRWTAIPYFPKWLRANPDVSRKRSWIYYGYVEVLPDTAYSFGIDGMYAAAGFLATSVFPDVPINPASAVIYVSSDPKVNFNWGTGAPAPDQVDLVGLMMHELLHVSGQDHVPDKQCANPNNRPIMCPWSARGSTNDRYPKFSDILGVRTQYPLGLRNRLTSFFTFTSQAL